jgi:hypothetical protein
VTNFTQLFVWPLNSHQLVKNPHGMCENHISFMCKSYLGIKKHSSHWQTIAVEMVGLKKVYLDFSAKVLSAHNSKVYKN